MPVKSCLSLLTTSIITGKVLGKVSQINRSDGWKWEVMQNSDIQRMTQGVDETFNDNFNGLEQFKFLSTQKA
jgi:hypothetical protein